MIVFDLSCRDGHRFEGWFASSEDFVSQQDRGLLNCPQCGSAQVDKAPMAPAVPAKNNRQIETKSPANQVSSGPPSPEVVKAVQSLAKAQEKALEGSTWVGEDFAEKSRAMHYGETDSVNIHGQATAEEAKGLADEGIAVAPLPFPVAPPEDLN